MGSLNVVCATFVFSLSGSDDTNGLISQLAFADYHYSFTADCLKDTVERARKKERVDKSSRDVT